MDHMIEHGDYMPHGMCLLWEPWLLLLWAGSDLLIFLSYTAIPIALLMVLRKRTEVPHARLVALFASFILLCGLTHFFGIVTLWYPIYPWVGLVKLATGLVSMTTAIVLFRLIPNLIALPSPAALSEANQRLRSEIAAHEKTLASLDALVKERTGELERATAALAVQTREAVHRSGNLLAVVRSLASQTARSASTVDQFLDAFLGRVQALADATASISREERASADLEQVVAAGLSVLKDTYGDAVTSEGPSLTITPEAAQQLSLALHELATNTQKYGLGAASGAQVAVRWQIEGGTFAFVWHERGVAQPGDGTTPPVEGFGSKLLLRIVPQMLRGEAVRTIEWGELTYRLSAPLDAVTARAAAGDPFRLSKSIIDTSFERE